MAKTRARKSKKATELPTQTDPTAPLDAAAFLKAAQPVLEILTKDLLQRAEESPGIARALAARHRYEIENKLTADKLEIWRRNIVVQIAAGWLLSCVFVRTLEDRGLLPHNRIAGPGATDAQHQFSQIAPYLNERDYLRTVFAELEHVPVVKALFDREHNLIWRLAPSAEATKALLGLFRAPEASAPAFRFGQSSTRFLGDLYQDLSEEVRKRFALLQTPDFIESFILDRTLEPAVEEFGLSETSVIDPTCGSGHFLLGAFERLFEKWCAAEPGAPVASAVEKALSAVVGVDINPYAVSIARFRLTLAALEKLGVQSLAAAPKLPLSVVVADSLSDGTFADLPEVAAGDWGVAFDFVDERAAKEVLRRSYEAVVGNPPYITVKDEALRERYRAMYEAAGGKYALSAPFMERFFQLARAGGFVGQITANSFMKREFGKGLVERVLPKEDVQLIVNTAGAYIPGHGTPTVLIFGRHRAPEDPRVHAVLARRGEPSTPEDPAQGKVWGSIRDRWGEEGFENEYITVEKVEREKLAKHPWSLEGGGAAALKALLEERGDKVLGDICTIGVFGMTNADEIFVRNRHEWSRTQVESTFLRPIAIGEEIRDWAWGTDLAALYPYNWPDDLIETEEAPGVFRYLWPFRSLLGSRATFGGGTYFSEGLPWWKWHQVTASRAVGPCIAFAFVATHNHFVYVEEGSVFGRSAPIIKLPATASKDDHFALLAFLNSSTACFWMKQVLFVKSSQNYVGDVKDKPERIHYEFAGTPLLRLPLPPNLSSLSDFGRKLHELGMTRVSVVPSRVIENCVDYDRIEQLLKDAERESLRAKSSMVELQDRLDQAVYELFDLLAALPHHSTGPSACVGDAPTRRPTHCHSTEAVRESLAAIIETPLYKRPWLGVQGVFHRDEQSYADLRTQALVELLLSRAEHCFALNCTQTSTQLFTQLQADVAGRAALQLLDMSQRQFLALLERESVPFLSALRFSADGIAKHRHWQGAWQQQARSDQGATVDVAPPPPRYMPSDYRSPQYMRLRGKLDIPAERFISYPGCTSGGDSSPVFGWRGWTPLAEAQALVALYIERKDREGWTSDALVPMLRGIQETIPALKRFRGDEPGGEHAEFFETWLNEELRALGTEPHEMAT